MSSSSVTPIENISQPNWLAVIAIGLATFCVVTTEMLPIGLLTIIASTLNVSTGMASFIISLPALLAAIFAPLVVILSGNVDRRKILSWLLILLIISNIVSALAPNLIWMLSARVLVGFCMGGIWAIAGGLAVKLVPTQQIGLATSIIFGGVAAASVLGVPLGTIIGDYIGWRWAFVCMAFLSALTLLLHLTIVPKLPVNSIITFNQFIKNLSNRKLLLGLLITLLLVTMHFMAFTFIRPLMLSISGFETKLIGILLFIYGITGIIGNFLVGIFAVNRTNTTLLLIAFGLLLIPILLLTIGNFYIGGILIMLIWGLAYGGVSVALMTWMINAVPRNIEIATAWYVSVFNIGIALGAWVGGLVVDQLGLIGNIWIAGILAAITFFIMMIVVLNKH